MCNIECLKTCPFEVINDKVIYEIHITVSYDEKFIEFCKNEGIKIVHIDMGNDVPTHLMTSHTYKGNRYEDETSRLIKLFIDNSYNIERIKVETTVNHPKALTNELNSYYETHIAIDKNISLDLCSFLKLHKSRNLMKKGDSKVQMLTFRSYSTLDNHESSIKNIEKILKLNGIIPLKVITEYCLLDNNVEMDNLWFRKNTI